MKKSVLALIIILSFPGVSIARSNSRIMTTSQWDLVQTGTFCLKSVHFINDNVGWVAGGPAL
ncbi:MAG: hypothetical protein ACTSP4_05650, partial [Candidatus Hodarchaeales archaeon]